MSKKKPYSSLNTGELNDEFKNRRKKLHQLRKQGIAFPNDFRPTYLSSELHLKFGNKNKIDLKNLNIVIRVAGRIITRRIMGKSSFVTLQDREGRIQLYIKYDIYDNNFYYNEFKSWDLGDIIGAQGILFKTNTNELSISCTKIRLLTKSLRPLPDKFHRLADKETCYRQRYLDLITNDQSRDTFILRSKIIFNIRKFMDKENFIEVETPIMQKIAGGAGAQPFITHHNALDINLYLRIAPELYLKRLVIGGLERIFELSRNFRNEGVSPRHHPEFTMMELYMAYADYKDLIKITENLLRNLTQKILGTSIIQYGKYTFDFNKSFTKLSMKEAILKYCPEINLNILEDVHLTAKFAKRLGINVKSHWGHGRILTEIFDISVEKHLIYPTFITDYPTEVSPLARSHDNYPFLCERFEFFINGYEIGNGFSELNDAEEQYNRFVQQRCNYQYDHDNHQYNNENIYDKDYIRALEHGMPPTAGLGIGIDRLVMIFTNKFNIRDVILFPTLRPEE
ncbi:MAG: lysine--tRNA ligase [Candidatus Dasytiphilus stammeri]